MFHSKAKILQVITIIRDSKGDEGCKMLIQFIYFTETNKQMMPYLVLAVCCNYVD